MIFTDANQLFINQTLPVAEKILDSNFGTLGPNQKWTADIKYIPTDEGWLFLNIIPDLHTRNMVGLAMRS